MTFDEQTRRDLIERVAQTIIDNVDKLTQLDQAIGDGDHGFNMQRGFEAVRHDIDVIAAKPLPDALKDVGMKLVMKVGGASGPLYGTLIMTLGKNLSSNTPSINEIRQALAVAIEAVKARGKSETGQKTMLDVLVPLSAALSTDAGDLAESLRVVARESADATVPMLAIKGRASFLGERSIGHMDPGACSTALITCAICDVVEASI